MPIKAILFDLDGVLVNTRTLHYETFKIAYEKNCPGKELSWKNHLQNYDGLSTKQKLNKMIQHNLITQEKSEKIFQEKQSITQQMIKEQVTPRPYLTQTLQSLRNKGYILACCTNSVRSTLDLTLESLNISSFFSVTLSNNDVEQQKPHPEIYKKCFDLLNTHPSETLICEDSPHGRKAAYDSGAHVLEIEDAEDLTYEKIHSKVIEIDSNLKSNTQKHINIVIPMAGEGSRFQKAGYTVPKPFILVKGKPMIQWVIENLQSSLNSVELFFFFLCRKSHLDSYPFSSILNSFGIKYKIIPIDSLTEGAACTVLLSKEFINTQDPLVIVNSDQYLEWDSSIFYSCLLNPTYDGIISTFYSPDPNDIKWSFARLDENLFVDHVAEKQWISPYGTTGIYGWSHGSDFVKYAELMIQKNIRVNNEFYICPVYNEAILDKKRFRTLECKKLWGLGVPDDLRKFLDTFKQEKIE
jgi:HAD superfamily hydrolase (TIGR01509 family)